MVRNPAETLNDPNLRSEYRRRLADALRLAKGYQGTEAECQALVKTLADLERWLVGVFGQEEGLRFPENLEEKVAENWQGVGRRRITDILRLGDERLSRHISEALGKREISESGLMTVDLEGVILPPGENGIKPGNGEGREVEDPRFQDRVRELILGLGEKGIHTDDIVLVRGNVRDSMMRKVSYAILEIPRLNREILVCDQVGEATFVVYGIQDRRILMSEGKGELRERLGACAMKVVYHDPGQWKKEVIGHLLRDVDIDALRKIDVRSQEGLRTEILKLIPTPEAWAEMSRDDKSAFKVAGMGLYAIARKFGVEGDPVGNHKFHLGLGRKVFGEGHECLEVLDQEGLKAKILRLVPTPGAWAKMSRDDKSAFKVAGMGLYAIATKFGEKGNPVNNHPVHLGLGRKIFDGGNRCLNELDTNELKTELLELCPTPGAWAGMGYEERLAFKVAGMGLYAIARKFGVEGNPISNHKFHLELGRRVFGEGHECLRFEEKPALGIEELRLGILGLVHTPEAWAGMKQKEKKKFKVSGMGLKAVATRFRTNGNPIGNLKFHLELGRRIFGEGHECLRFEEKPALDIEELRLGILGLVHTPEAWAGMGKGEKLEFKVASTGLNAIARKFGVEGDPVGYHKFHLGLGRKVFGEGHECLEVLDQEGLKAKILRLVPTPGAWEEMNAKEKSAFKVAGMGLYAIATKFGIEGSPIGNHSIHLKLGEKIYGENKDQS